MDRFIKNKYIEKLFWYSWYIVIGLSVSAEYLIGRPFSPNFFSNDQNWLNQKMVKWGWGWTFYSVITFSIFINLADQNVVKNIFRTVIRVFGFGTLIWYFGTQLTFKIGDLTGSCFDSNGTQILEIKSLRSCKSVFGSRWESFDISGHTFLLIWCMYISAYELKQFSLFRQKTHPFMIELAVFLLFGWVTCLNFLWLIMLIATQLFFHNLAEKVLAKLLVDLFLLLFLRLNAQLESILPLNKAKDV